MAEKEMRISSWKQESRKCLVCGTMFFHARSVRNIAAPNAVDMQIVTAAVLLEEL